MAALALANAGKAASFLTRAWKVIIPLGLTLLTVPLALSLWDEWQKTVAVIGYFETPEVLQKQGYTSQVLGMHLKDALAKIEQGAHTDMPHDPAIIDFQQADLPLSNGMTLRTGLRFLKQILHHPDIQISGDTIVDGENLELRVRVVDANGKAYMRSSGKETKIENALEGLAKPVMNLLDPNLLGYYWIAQQQQSCLEEKRVP